MSRWRMSEAASRSSSARASQAQTKSHRHCSGVLVETHPLGGSGVGQSTDDRFRFFEFLLTHDPRLRIDPDRAQGTIERYPKRADLAWAHLIQDDEKVEIAVRPLVATRPGAKEDDLANAGSELPQGALGEVASDGEVGRADACGHRKDGTRPSSKLTRWRESRAGSGLTRRAGQTSRSLTV